MAKKPFKLPPGIKLVGLGKATFSFVLALAVAAILMVILYYSVGIPVILNNSDFAAMNAAVDNGYVNSGLVTKDGGNYRLFSYVDTTGTTAEEYAYKKYAKAIWDYFTVVIPGDPNMTADVTFTANEKTYQGFKGEAVATNAEYGKWIYVTFLGYNETAAENSFFPSVEGDFTSAPTGLDEANKHFLLATLMNDVAQYKGYYPTVVIHLQNQPYLLNCQRKMRMDNYVSTLPTFIIPPIVIFFILPLSLPHGKTLGKLILGEAVVSIEGYRARKIQLVVRQFVITTIWLLLALPWQVVAWPSFMLLMLVGYMSKVLSKKGQSVHDMLAGTVAIDSRKSVWFASEEEEQSFVAEHPSSPISRQYQAEEREAENRRASAAIEAEESILDSSTIDKRRAEARAMTSFDEFERNSDAEFAKREEALKEREIEGEEPVDEETEKAAFRDLAAMEGLSEEEAAALAKSDGEEAVVDDTPDDSDGFTDGKKD